MIASVTTALVAEDGQAGGILVRAGAPVGVRAQGKAWRQVDGALQCSGKDNVLVSTWGLGKGDFQITAKLSVTKLNSTAASFVIGKSHFGFDGLGKMLFTEGPLFGGKVKHRGKSAAHVTEGKVFEFAVARRGGKIAFQIDGKVIAEIDHDGAINGFGFRPYRGEMRIVEFVAKGSLVKMLDPPDLRVSGKPPPTRRARIGKGDLAALRMAIEDLGRTFPGKYKRSAEFLARLDRISKQAGADQDAKLAADFIALKREALLTNPLLDFERLLVIRRRIGRDAARFDGGMWGFNSRSLGIPDTGSGNTILPRKGFDNEIALLAPVNHDGQVKTVYKPRDKVYVRDIDLHWDGEKILFSSLDAKGRW